jgi:hypothetical protein
MQLDSIGVREARMLVVGAMFLLVARCQARAAVMQYLTDQKLCELASIIVKGRIVSVMPVLLPGGTKVMTRARLLADDYIKGPPDAPQELELVSVGGQVGDVATLCPGMPRFRAGEKVVVFLCPCEENAYRVLALSRGKYLVERHPDNGAEVVTLDLSGLTQIDPGTGEEVQADLIPACHGKVYLEDFVSTLKRAVRVPRSK